MNLQDVSVVVPTLNSRSLLEPVLPRMREWMGQVGEVIVVDSHSTDGTLDVLRAALDFPHAKFLSHPPGLYASWNHGISQATREVLSIATAGDAISLEDLEYLVSVAGTSGADVVIAPPVFCDREGKALPDARWPLLQLLEAHKEQDEIPLSGDELVYFALFHCRPPVKYDCWLGSSASNLYRTKVLQAHPFPTHAGNFGDTLFALEQAWHLKAVFCRRRCGKFVVHNHTDLRSPEDRQRLFEVFDGPWKQSFSRLSERLAMAEPANRMVQFLLADLARSGAEVEKLRDKLWSETGKKDRLRTQLEELKSKAAREAVPGWIRKIFERSPSS